MAPHLPQFTGDTRPSAADLDDALDWAAAHVIDARALGVVGDWNGSTGTDNRAALQEAIDEAYGLGHAVVMLPATPAMVDGTIEVPQGVLVRGRGLGGFRNPYIDNAAGPVGSAIVAAPGMNANVVEVTCRLTASGGTLYETGRGTRNHDARHCGGLEGLMVWGTRSTIANPPSAVGLNTTGDCVVFRGTRRAILRNVITMWGARDGFVFTERNYGTGLFGCNNMQVLRPIAMSCARYGHNYSVGDSEIMSPEAGYCGSHGFLVTLGNTDINGGSSWNCGGSGLYAGPNNLTSVSAIRGFRSYDNDGIGVQLEGTGVGATLPELRNVVCRGNGRNAALPAWQRSNFLIGSNAWGVVIDGCTASAYDQAGDVTAQHGFYINNSTHNVVFGAGNHAFGHPGGQDFFFADVNRISNHAGTRHSGVVFTGDCNMAGYAMRQVAHLSFSAWATFNSITSGTLSISTSNSLYTLNFTGSQTVTDLVYTGSGSPLVVLRNVSADPVTLQHNASKLRLANGANVVLQQYEAVVLLHVSGNIFQQIGAAA